MSQERRAHVDTPVSVLNCELMMKLCGPGKQLNTNGDSPSAFSQNVRQSLLYVARELILKPVITYQPP